MRSVEHAGITLATESFGQPGDPVVMLVMGATASKLGWPDEFCTALAESGLFIIRFDHRDTGESTTVPPGSASYAVEDLASDAVAILDAYRLDAAHLVGMSLGGLIAQMVALANPDRIASLTLIATEPLGWDGEPLPNISPKFLAHFEALGALDWSDREAVAGFLLNSEKLCAGTGTPFDQGREKARIERVLSRTKSPASMFNHAALTLREDWTGRFREITCPVLVVHGEEDTILPIENGQAIAAGLKGASLHILSRTGHELPLSRIPEITERIAEHVEHASD